MRSLLSQPPKCQEYKQESLYLAKASPSSTSLTGLNICLIVLFVVAVVSYADRSEVNLIVVLIPCD